VEITRDRAWETLTRYTASESLRRHALAVEASTRSYARRFGEDEELWGGVALLHDFDWEIHPTLDQHPQDGAAILRQRGVDEEIIHAIGEGRRPPVMKADEEVVYDFCAELLRSKGVCDFTYQRAVEAFGEHGVIDIVGVAGYFITVSMVLNVAHTPPSHDAGIEPLQAFPY
jgi:putative nucleotidyltransferase with HDIG domain